MLWSVLAGILLLIIGPRVSTNMLLNMYHARQLSTQDAPQLHELISELSQRAELKHIPSIYYIPSQIMNAFTLGKPKNASIAISEGLLRHLTLRELAGVFAHEISHIRNNDMSVMSLADVVTRMTRLLSLFGQLLVIVNLPLIILSEVTISWFAILLLIFAPTLTALMQLALSRHREFDADLGAVMLTGDAHGLASALAKLERVQDGFVEKVLGSRKPGSDPSILRTHPHTQERIKRLISLADKPPVVTPISVPKTDRFHIPQHISLLAHIPRKRFTRLWH